MSVESELNLKLRATVTDKEALYNISCDIEATIGFEDFETQVPL